MASILTLDLETLPSDPDGWVPREPIEAPANYKDPEKIAAYVAAKSDEAHAKTSFDVHQGRLLCIGYALDDDPPNVSYHPEDVPRMLTDLHDAFREGLRRGNGRCAIVGFNIAGFDAPWIWRLAVKHRHPLAQVFPFTKWGDGLVDVMLLWSATNPREFAKLSTIAAFLDLAGKPEGITGASVWPMYQEGRHAEIRAYCAGDVETVRAVYRRIGGCE